MTSTNTFQGLEDGAKPSSRVLRPPGGGSSNIFGGYEDNAGASRRTNKMASTIFTPQEEPQGAYKRSNPPGGKSSGIFGEPEAASPKHKPPPSGGTTSNIFGGPDPNPNLPTVKSHPNKPKDNISMGSAVTVEAPAPQPKKPVEVKEVAVSPQVTPIKEPPPPEPTATKDTEPSPSKPSEKDHEPRLGPRPRSHNKVLNPPGGKSSVVFY